MAIQLVVCDLDGTLLHDDKTLDSSIQSLLESNPNFKFTIASGRNFHIVQDLVSQLHIDIPYILNNGANMWLKDICLFNASMDSTQLKKACDLLVAEEVSFLAYTNDAIYSVGNPNKLGQFMDRLKGKCHLIYDANIDDFIHHEVFKMIMIDTKMEGIKHRINSGCPALCCVQSEGVIYSLTSQLASKGKTLQRLMDQLGLTKEEVLVFGDNYNDASMFDVAMGVAMGNAQEPLKEKAIAITRSNNEDGVSYFLSKYIIKKQASSS